MMNSGGMRNVSATVSSATKLPFSPGMTVDGARKPSGRASQRQPTVSMTRPSALCEGRSSSGKTLVEVREKRKTIVQVPLVKRPLQVADLADIVAIPVGEHGATKKAGFLAAQLDAKRYLIVVTRSHIDQTHIVQTSSFPIQQDIEFVHVTFVDGAIAVLCTRLSMTARQEKGAAWFP
jgi:hypothetical protein